MNINKKDMSYDLIKDVKVTSIEHYFDFNHRMDVSKYKQLDRTLNGLAMSSQGVLDRLAKHFPYSICKSWVDAKKKTFNYEYIVNADTTNTHVVDFEKAAKLFGVKNISYDEKLDKFSIVKE